jgi:hypothetical protein
MKPGTTYITYNRDTLRFVRTEDSMEQRGKKVYVFMLNEKKIVKILEQHTDFLKSFKIKEQ